MTEEEAKKALFELHFEYMQNPPKKRLELYNEYQEKRSMIRKALVQAVFERKEREQKTK